MHEQVLSFVENFKVFALTHWHGCGSFLFAVLLME